MPLIYVNCPMDTFTSEARNGLAQELCEITRRLAASDIGDTVTNTWVGFRAHPSDAFYVEGKHVSTQPVMVEVKFWSGEEGRYPRDVMCSYLTDAIHRRSTAWNDSTDPVYISFSSISSTQTTSSESMDDRQSYRLDVGGAPS